MTVSTCGDPEWLTNFDLARKFDVSISTVRGWRRDDRGPRGVRIGGRVKYHRDDVAAWIADRYANEVHE